MGFFKKAFNSIKKVGSSIGNFATRNLKSAGNDAAGFTGSMLQNIVGGTVGGAVGGTDGTNGVNALVDTGTYNLSNGNLFGLGNNLLGIDNYKLDLSKKTPEDKSNWFSNQFGSLSSWFKKQWKWVLGIGSTLLALILTIWYFFFRNKNTKRRRR